MYGHARAGFPDLRIIDATGSQVPWRPVPTPAAVPSQPVAVVARGRRDGTVTVVLDRGAVHPVIDRVELEIPDADVRRPGRRLGKHERSRGDVRAAFCDPRSTRFTGPSTRAAPRPSSPPPTTATSSFAQRASPRSPALASHGSRARLRSNRSRRPRGAASRARRQSCGSTSGSRRFRWTPCASSRRRRPSSEPSGSRGRTTVGRSSQSDRDGSRASRDSRSTHIAVDGQQRFLRVTIETATMRRWKGFESFPRRVPARCCCRRGTRRRTGPVRGDERSCTGVRLRAAPGRRDRRRARRHRDRGCGDCERDVRGTLRHADVPRAERLGRAGAAGRCRSGRGSGRPARAAAPDEPSTRSLRASTRRKSDPAALSSPRFGEPPSSGCRASSGSARSGRS